MNPITVQIISNFWLQKYSDTTPCVQLDCAVKEGLYRPYTVADTGFDSVPALFRYDCFA